MPKKFAGENSKAVAARARKASAKEVENAKKQKEMEEAYWKDEEKHILRKQQRKVNAYLNIQNSVKYVFVGRTREEETNANRKKSRKEDAPRK